MKYLSVIVLAIVLLATGCSQKNVKCAINEKGEMFYKATEKDKDAFVGSPNEVSREFVKFRENNSLAGLYAKYDEYIAKGELKKAKEIRIEIEVREGKIVSTPDTPVENPQSTTELKSDVPADDPNYGQKRYREYKEDKKKGVFRYGSRRFQK